MIKILKASAGSGKTFRLAKKYIEILLRSSERDAYRHILAVTFTNKATEEMKSRILGELYILAKTPEESNYLKDFTREFGTPQQISDRAGRILLSILHDYSAFSISTIDKFFQTALKAFARELGQFSSYQVELDRESLVQESVDRMLDSVTEDDKAVIGWLSDSVKENLEDGGFYNLDNKLYEIAKAIHSDGHRIMVEQGNVDEDKTGSKKFLLGVRNVCRETRDSFLKDCVALARQATGILESAGVPAKESSNGFFDKLYDYQVPETIDMPTGPWMEKALDSEKWFAKAKAKEWLPRLAGKGLDKVLEDLCTLFRTRYPVFKTSTLILGQIYGLGMAGEIRKAFDALVKEKNVMCLDDSNTILRGIIGGSDAPFIYEKLGVRFEDFLLDEFQDTSTVQWENFAPLLAESDAAGGDNLIVGDVKQSIYRWRGSEWSLLDSGVKGRFPRADDSESLRSNRRSLDTIVSFNNGFFEYAAGLLDGMAGTGKISKIYSDVSQEVVSGNPGDGFVDVSFVLKDEQPRKVLEVVRDVYASGARYGDIAVLVRTNKQGSALASFLLSEGIPVLSDDSLNVKSSPAVRRLVSLLALVDNPSDKVGGFMAENIGITIPGSYSSLVGLAEDLLREMVSKGFSLDGEVLYIQSFMDELQDWTAVNGNHLGGFLSDWKTMDSKISSPAGDEAVRVITIHKAKGLQYPCVIVPFVEDMTLSGIAEKWVLPDFKGTPLEPAGDAGYYVTLSGTSEETLFRDDYRKERLLQYVDNINTLYVALTRAEKELYVVSGIPAQPRGGFKNFAQMLKRYPEEKGIFHTDDGFTLGRRYDYSGLERKKAEAQDLPASYKSYPAEDRLRLKYDSFDYFGEEGPSRRLKGILLHDILSSVYVPSDLERAVNSAVQAGDIVPEEAEAYTTFLRERISSRPEWFPPERAGIFNEQDIIDASGGLNRPDRVVTRGTSAVIIDYKFGDPHPSYRRQLARYVSLYRSLGFTSVSAYLWYVEEDKVEEV